MAKQRRSRGATETFAVRPEAAPYLACEAARAPLPRDRRPARVAPVGNGRAATSAAAPVAVVTGHEGAPVAKRRRWDEWRSRGTRDPTLRARWRETVKGTYGAVFNASNEVAVRAFLKDEIPFLMIEEIIDHFMDTHKNIAHPTYDTIELIDRAIRQQVKEYIWPKK